MDRDSGRSKGFGFVTMNNDEEGKAAMAALDGKELDGRSIKVNEARPQEERRPSGGNPLVASAFKQIGKAPLRRGLSCLVPDAESALGRRRASGHRAGSVASPSGPGRGPV